MQKFFDLTNEFFSVFAATDWVKKCVVCGTYDHVKWWENKDCQTQFNRYAQCVGCRFVWLMNQPVATTLQVYYRESDAMAYWYGIVKNRSYEKARQDSKWKFLSGYIGANAGDGKSILDYGGGDGSFLASLPDSMDKYLYEPGDVARIAAAGNCPKATLLQEYSGSYDFISALGVLEHVKDPAETVLEFARHLNPGGLLVTIVPNVGSLAAQVLGGEWSSYCPQHLWFWSMDTLRLFMYRNGFDLVAHDTSDNEVQPILRKMAGMPPYGRFGSLKMKNVWFDENYIWANDLGTKLCCIWRRKKDE